MTTAHKFSGAKIRAARHDAGMTQAALAHAVNTRERNIIRWENDQHEPRFENVSAIAKVTGKPLDFFTADDGQPSDDDAEAAQAMSPGGDHTELLEALHAALTLALTKVRA